MAIHDGKKAPQLGEDWNPADTDKVYISWTTKLDGAAITSSTWILPTGWTLDGSEEDISVTIDGVLYADTNSATLSTTNTSGTHYIANRITTDTGLTLERGLYVEVDSKL